MAVQLKKGGRVNLTKDAGLTKAMIGLGWDTNRYQGSADFDLDLVLFLCDSNGKCLGEPYFVFYGNLQDPQKAVVHQGDNRSGVGDGDDEIALIDFAKLDPRVESIIVAVTIYEAHERRQNFGLVDNAYVRVLNPDKNNEVVLRYDLTEDFSIQTSLVFAKLYKAGGEWRFAAVGEGYDKELSDLCHEYGIATA